jgi:phage FluMu gp28-like protein
MFFLPYQKRWIEDSSRLKIMVKSRQIGMSWTSAYKTLRQSIAPATRLDTWIASRDETQARLFLDDVRKFAIVINKASPILAQERKLCSGVIELLNGIKIHSLSSNADAQAGKRGHRILDEFALHPDPQKLYSIAYPGITWGGQLEIISTHRGSQNFFNKLIEEIYFQGNPKGFSLHKVTLPDAIGDGFLDKLQAKLPEEDPRKHMDEDTYQQFIKDGCPDEETWNQEYMCIPGDDKTAFLSSDLITRCENSSLQIPKIPKSRTQRLYLGIDLARDHDFTVFWLLKKEGEHFQTCDIQCLKNTSFDRQEAILYSYMNLPGLQRMCVDATGLGRQFAERATKRYGASKVEAITLTANMKEDLAYPLRQAFECGKIEIPGDEKIRSDLSAIRISSSSSGYHVRFTAERSKNGHADRFWALALALHAGSKTTEGKAPTVVPLRN